MTETCLNCCSGDLVENEFENSMLFSCFDCDIEWVHYKCFKCDQDIDSRDSKNPICDTCKLPKCECGGCGCGHQKEIDLTYRKYFGYDFDDFISVGSYCDWCGEPASYSDEAFELCENCSDQYRGTQ